MSVEHPGPQPEVVAAPTDAKPEAQPKRERSKTLTALFLALAIHGGAGYAGSSKIRSDVNDAGSAVSRFFRNSYEKIFGAKQEAGYKAELRKVRKVDEGAFFMKSESFHGISEAETKSALVRLKNIREKNFPQEKEKDDPLRRLFELSKEKGRYVPDSTFLSDLLNKGVGNCEARVKFDISTIPQLFPSLPHKLQWFTASKERPSGHVRSIVRVEGEWYELETFQALSANELDGTVITSTDEFVRMYTGTKSSGRLIEGGKKVPPPDHVKPTDTFFKPSFPEKPTKAYDRGDDAEESVAEYETRKELTYEEVVEGEVTYAFVTNEQAEELRRKSAQQQVPGQKIIVPISHGELTDAKIMNRVEKYGRGANYTYDLGGLNAARFSDLALYHIEVANVHFGEFSPKVVVIDNVKGLPANLLPFAGKDLERLTIVSDYDQYDIGELLNTSPNLQELRLAGKNEEQILAYLEQLRISGKRTVLTLGGLKSEAKFLSITPRIIESLKKLENVNQLYFREVKLDLAFLNELPQTEIEVLIDEPIDLKPIGAKIAVGLITINTTNDYVFDIKHMRVVSRNKQ